MRKIALLALLLLPARLNAQFAITWEGGTTGGNITNSNILASLHGCTTGVTTNNPSTTSAFTYGSVNAAPVFPALTNVCGSILSGQPNKPLVLNTASSPIQNFQVFFPATTKASFGQARCYDFDYAAAAQNNKSYSGDFLEATSTGSGANIIYSQNSQGLSLESNSNFTQAALRYTAYHGSTSSCALDANGHPVDNNSWVWVTISANAGTAHQIAIYKILTDGSLSLVLSGADDGTAGGGHNPNQSGNANVLEVGKSGGESETAGFHTYTGSYIVDNVNGTFPLLPNQHLWGGIIAPARATDWNAAGVVGGIPSAAWTQCGSTIAPYNGTATTINSAITACGANQYVLLGNGTFNLTTAISFGRKSNVVLRGGGANSTFLLFSDSAITGTCLALNAVICNKATDPSFITPGVTFTVSGSLAQGSTSLTIGGGTPAITPNLTMLYLAQCDDGKSGNPCTGTSVDNGGYFNCGDKYATSSGCSLDGPDTGNGFANRMQEEIFLPTAFSSGTGVVTLDHGLRNPNWNTANTPLVWVIQPVTNFGLENMSVDTSGVTTLHVNSSCFEVLSGTNWWVKGVRFSACPLFGVYAIQGTHFNVQDSYFATTVADPSAHTCDGQACSTHAINLTMTSDSLVLNNIIQKYEVPIHTEGPGNGHVIAYNFMVGDFYPLDNMEGSIRLHSNGNTYNLIEGNVATLFYPDITHGTEPMNTAMRNLFIGWGSCANNQCGGQTAKDFHTNAIIPAAGSRGDNLIGNVLGTPGYHTQYQTTGSAVSVLSPGEGGASSPVTPTDSIVSSTLMRWGNYDVFNAAIRFVSGEVPSGASAPFTNTVPASQIIPASFWTSSKPSFFGSIAWPPIGPDVTSGNVGQCSGTLNALGKQNGLPALASANCPGSSLTASSWAGHANAIPAMACFFAMGGLPDGTNGILPYDASTCPNAPAGPTVSFSPPSSLTFSNQSVNTPSSPRNVTLSNVGSAQLNITSIVISGGNSGDFSITNTTCGSTLAASSSCVITLAFTPTAIGSRSTTLVFTTNASTSPDNYTLSGNGVFVTAPAVQITMTGQANITGTHTAR